MPCLVHKRLDSRLRTDYERRTLKLGGLDDRFAGACLSLLNISLERC